MKPTHEQIEAGLLKLKNNHRPLYETGQPVDERNLVVEILTAALSASPAGVGVETPVAWLWEEEVEGKLHSAGFTVIPSIVEEYRELGYHITPLYTRAALTKEGEQ